LISVIGCRIGKVERKLKRREVLGWECVMSQVACGYRFTRVEFINLRLDVLECDGDIVVLGVNLNVNHE
jgi:hypothetical protein